MAWHCNRRSKAAELWRKTYEGKYETVAPRYKEPRYGEDPVITNNIWKPGRITVKYVETNNVPRYNEPRYDEDSVITNNIWKPSIITEEYVETNPALTKSPLQRIDFDGPNAQFTPL